MTKPVTHYNKVVFALHSSYSVERRPFDKTKSILASLIDIGSGFLLGKTASSQWNRSVIQMTALATCGLIGTSVLPKSIDKRVLNIGRYALAYLAAAGTSFLLAQLETHHSFRDLTYPVLGMTAVSVCGLIGTCAFKKPASLYPFLVSPEEIDRLGLKKVIHELCGMDEDGNNLSISIERMQEILKDLKDRDLIYAINSIPRYYLDKEELLLDERYPNTIKTTKRTPLQHWAYKGNVEAVRLLLQYGASDYCHCKKADKYSLRTISALYLAVLSGHEEIVTLLLETGASADIYFKWGSRSNAFIPLLVFELGQGVKKSNTTPACLRRIFQSLKTHQPKSLEYQLKIPVTRKQENCLVWITNYAKKKILHPEHGQQYPETLKSKELKRIEELEKVLIDFGASEDSAFSYEELKDLGFVKTGFRSLEAEALSNMQMK